MLLSRDYVGHMAKEVIKRLVASKMIAVQHLENGTTQDRQVLAVGVTIGDRINEEGREILPKYAEEVRTSGASYQEMYKKVKGQLARERTLILRSYATQPRKNRP